MSSKTVKTIKPASSGTDAYNWSNPAGGNWATAGNWTDTTQGATATAAPGSGNAVTITGGVSDFIDITGSGSAASLTIGNPGTYDSVAGNVLLWGTVAVGGVATIANNADLELDGGATLTAAGLVLAEQFSYGAVQGATLEVTGGSAVAVSGTAQSAAGLVVIDGNSSVQFGALSGNTTDLLLFNGGKLRVGGLVENNSISSFSDQALGSSISLDATSSMEVGSVGGAALGALTVDQGQTATISGAVHGNVVVNGVLAVQAGGHLTMFGTSTVTGKSIPAGTVSGAGTLSVSENGWISLGADSAAIRFAGPNGGVYLSSLPTGAISGFTNGDTLDVGFANAVTATIGASSTVLKLTENGVSAGSITLTGVYAGDLFHMSFTPYGDADITVRTPGTLPQQPGTITGTAGQDTLTATANNQTLTGLGGGDTLDGGGYSGVVFKDTSANLNGSSIINGNTSDVIDLTDMVAASATATYTPTGTVNGSYQNGSVLVSDGTHTATIALPNDTQTGFFIVSSDGAGGTKLVFSAVQTSATANNQTLGALGGSETLYGNAFTGIDFKATSAKLTGATLQGFQPTDTIDVTDLALASATLTYTPQSYNYGTDTASPGTLSIGSATVYFPYVPGSFLPTGYFNTVSDGAGGTDVVYLTVQTSASANNQTLGGVGGVETLYGNDYTGIDFKGATARMTGATLSGFTGSDTIDITDMASASATVSFSPPYYAGYPTDQEVAGSMTIADGTHTVTLTFPYGLSLPEGYFATASDGAGGTRVTYVAVNTDAYAFANPLGGAWSTAANWTDTTTSAAATAAASYGNSATIAGGTGYLDIAGSGYAASLTTSGDVLLLGAVALGAKVSGVSGNLTQTGTLALDGGATLTALGTATLGGYLEVDGGSKLTSLAAEFQNGSALMAAGGGAIQFAGVYFDEYYQGSSASVIGVDSASSIEFGTTGGAAKGAVTVDGGQTVELSGTVEGNVVVNGTLEAVQINGFSLNSSGLVIAPFGGGTAAVTGGGTLAIQSGAALTLGMADSAAIAMQGSNDTLSLTATLPTGTISGFAAGDTITLNQAVTSLSYVQTTGSIGTLTLKNGATTIGALTLAGSFAAGQFQLQTNGAGASASILYSPTPGTTPGTQISGTSDTFSWQNANGGVWSYAGNWTDNGSTATTAPGPNNAVYFNDYPTGPQIVSGSGSAASVTVGAATVFMGNLSVGGEFDVESSAGIVAGAVVTAGSLYVDGYVQLEINGAATLNLTGSSSDASIYGTLDVVSGSAVHVGGQGYGSDVEGVLAVDGTSTVEFGSTGGAAAGAITVDSGQDLSVQNGGTIAGAVALTGTIDVYGTATIEGFAGRIGSVTGAGAIVLAGYDDLVLNATDSAAINFQSTGSKTLELAAALPTGTISGFVAGDTIRFDQTITGASFNSGTGKLTLTKGATTVGTLTFAGITTGKLFQLDTNAATGVSTLTLQTAPAAAGTSAASTNTDAYAWTGASSNVWSTAANWTDTHTGTTPTTVAGAGNAVTIAGTTSGGYYTTIGGNGAAASLAISGNVLMTGTVAVGGAITLASLSPAPRLALASAAKLSAASLSDAGVVQVAQGSSLTLTGGATLNAGGALQAMGGSFVLMKGLVGNGGTIAIDSSSTIDFGTIATPTAGALNLSGSAVGAFSGAIFGSLVNPGVIAVEAGASLFIDMAGTAEADPYGTPTISGGGALQIAEGATLGLGVASADQVQFTGPNGTLDLSALPTVAIHGFVQGDSIVVDQPVTGLVASNAGGAESLKLMEGSATYGILTLAFTPAAGQQFHLDVAPGGGSATITLQSAGIAATQPTLIAGTLGTDLLYATANGQTLTGNGGGDTLNGGAFTGLDFKDTAANLTGAAIQNFATSDMIDLTTVASASATLSYTGGVLGVSDGTHAATISLGFASTPGSGGFHAASDGASGTLITWH